MKTDLLSSASSAAIAAATVVAVTEAAHVIHWDIESRSLINLEEQGAARYASDPSTEVTVISYTVDDGPVEYYIPGHDPIPPVFFTAAADPSWRIASHNDAFETWMTVGVLGPRFGWPMVPIERHICTMAMARYHGLPGALEKVAAYLELPVQKDAAGKRLMLKLSRPDKNGNFIEPTADELKQLIAYCKRDVEVERAIFHALAALPASEQALWQLDHRINARGFAIDIALVARARHLAAIEKENINARLCTATCGAITSFTQVETIRKFVNARGLAMAELNKAAVIAALKLDIDSLAREVLELRQAAAGNIEAKFDAVLATILPNRRGYGLLHFYGTHTGRWTSSGFNVHNLPREAGDHIGAAIAAIQADDLERLRELGPPLKLIASTVRGLVIAPPGKRLLIGDFSTIEPRIAAWLADETWKIENFFAFDRTGDPMLDTYRVLGSKMRGVPVDPKDKATRQHGKTVTMAFTFGAGPNVWRKHVPDDPRTDAEIRAQEVMQFRRLHPKQTQFMYMLEAQALRCVASRKPVVDKRHGFEMMGNTLVMWLPNGRPLFYPRARIVPGRYNNGSAIAYYKAKVNCEVEMWYGSWIAHLVSATARDLLVNALHKLDRAGFEIILHVHDEVVAEIDATGAVDKETFKRCMLDAPAWAEGLPFAAEVRDGARYIKAETERSSDLTPDEIMGVQPEHPTPRAKPAKPKKPTPAASAVPPGPEPTQKTKPELAPKPAAAAAGTETPREAPAAGKQNGVHAATAERLQTRAAGIEFPMPDKSETMIDLADLVSETVPVPKRSRKICCPFHTEATPSLHIYRDHFYCFGCNRYGDHLDWLVQVERLSLTEAVKKLADWNGPTITQTKAETRDIEADAKRAANALQWWNGAVPIEGTLAARYLTETRGIDISVLPSNITERALRFHPKCVFGAGIFRPCLLALMRDPVTGVPTGIQRIAIDQNAKKIGRMMLGPAGVVQLWWASHEKLVIGEGLETTLAAATRLDYRGEPLRPAWATLSDGAMTRFPVIDDIKQLVILADNDSNGAGQKAAATCKQRWREAGRRGAVLMPPRRGSDFNDFILERLAAKGAVKATMEQEP